MNVPLVDGSAAEIPADTETVVDGPHELVGEALFLGLGDPVAKSAALLLVSVQPLLPLNTDVVLLGEGVTPNPSKQFVHVPNPTKSIILPPVGQLPVNAVVELTNATLPAVPDMLMVPVASGVGKLVVPPAPAAS